MQRSPLQQKIAEIAEKRERGRVEQRAAVEDSFERDELFPPRFQTLPHITIDYRNIECSRPEALLGEPPNNDA